MVAQESPHCSIFDSLALHAGEMEVGCLELTPS